ncbi:ATP-binding protein [Actinoplanes sp. M2I2]|uniref:ATP-binding protein n=1 Tax=Actinoplanes sp. M2I2 TaxID=1734444 RepID=UPI002020B8D1|nr:ATP-binding protein [Actinoplanes sp. M2I2]
MSVGILMYGPPASGKDTVTKALTESNPLYRHFRRLKVGGGRTDGYRITSPEKIADLKSTGGIVWENERYGASYYVDQPSLAQDLSEACPVLHLGQPAAIHAVTEAFPETRWVIVQLWCPRDLAEQRVIQRATGDVAERMAIWDDTEHVPATITIDTATVSPGGAARQIDQAVQREDPWATLSWEARRKAAVSLRPLSEPEWRQGR